MNDNEQFPDNKKDVKGSGKWDTTTTRYVPLGGGSRSRLPAISKGIRPYSGYRNQSKDNHLALTMAELYALLAGGSTITLQDRAFIIGQLKEAEKISVLGLEGNPAEESTTAEEQISPAQREPAPSFSEVLFKNSSAKSMFSPPRFAYGPPVERGSEIVWEDWDDSKYEL